MRNLCWFICGAAFCYLLANNTGSIVGVSGEIEAIAYGGLNGLGIAVATRSKLSWSLHFRFLMGVLWTIALVVMYVFVFGSLGQKLKNQEIFWGVIFGAPAWLISFVRGIPMLWSSRLPQSESERKELVTKRQG
jgi:hypothetical protein